VPVGVGVAAEAGGGALAVAAAFADGVDVGLVVATTFVVAGVSGRIFVADDPDVAGGVSDSGSVVVVICEAAGGGCDVVVVAVVTVSPVGAAEGVPCATAPL